jgi:hypothetical protein
MKKEEEEEEGEEDRGKTSGGRMDEWRVEDGGPNVAVSMVFIMRGMMAWTEGTRSARRSPR